LPNLFLLYLLPPSSKESPAATSSAKTHNQNEKFFKRATFNYLHIIADANYYAIQTSCKNIIKRDGSTLTRLRFTAGRNLEQQRISLATQADRK